MPLEKKVLDGVFSLLHKHPVKKEKKKDVKCSHHISVHIVNSAPVCVWMNHKSILCGFWPQSGVFPPEQERPASVRIGLGFSFS